MPLYISFIEGESFGISLMLAVPSLLSLVAVIGFCLLQVTLKYF